MNAEDSSPLPFGEIEVPRPLRAPAGRIAIQGWCFFPDSDSPPPIRLVTGAATLNARGGLPRADLAALHPKASAAAHSGFVITGAIPAGSYLARFEAQRPAGAWCVFKLLSLVVEPTPLASALESFPPGTLVTQRVTLDGWALHPEKPITALAIRYGHREIPCTLGWPRSDVPALFPQHPQAAHAGFQTETILGAGAGPLRLKATLADGSTAIARVPLQIAVSTDENHERSFNFTEPPLTLPRVPAPAPPSDQPKAASPERILFVLPGSFASNSALHVAALANELVRAGHQCAVAVPHDVATLAHHCNPAFRGVSYEDAARGAAFGENGPEATILHAWTTRENVRHLVTKLRARSQPRVLVHLEDNEQQVLAHTLGLPIAALAELDDATLDTLVPPDLSHPRRAREFLASADGITVITDRLREFGPPNRPCLTLIPAADARYFHAHPLPAKFRAILDRRAGETVLFYHGNVHASNLGEVSELYAAVVQLNASGIPVTLIRTGLDRVPFAEPLSRAVTPHVLSLGQILHHQHLPALLALADFFVQPGSPDAFNDYRFPSKLPEFFAIGRPVILPRTNLGERVRHGIDAYVLDRADAASIAAAIIALRQDPDLCAQLSRGALAFAREHFSWTRSAAELAGFYHTIARA